MRRRNLAPLATRKSTPRSFERARAIVCPEVQGTDYEYLLVVARKRDI